MMPEYHCAGVCISVHLLAGYLECIGDFGRSVTRRRLMRTIHTSSALATLCACTGLLFSGCGGLGHSWSGNSTSGAGCRTIESFACDGRVFLVVAINGCLGGESGSEFGTGQGQVRALDGRTISWSYSTKDG